MTAGFVDDSFHVLALVMVISQSDRPLVAVLVSGFGFHLSSGLESLCPESCTFLNHLCPDDARPYVPVIRLSCSFTEERRNENLTVLFKNFNDIVVRVCEIPSRFRQSSSCYRASRQTGRQNPLLSLLLARYFFWPDVSMGPEKRLVLDSIPT